MQHLVNYSGAFLRSSGTGSSGWDTRVEPWDSGTRKKRGTRKTQTRKSLAFYELTKQLGPADSEKRITNVMMCITDN